MVSLTDQATFTVTLVGNPNTGKSTLFNALCGLRQRVGNFPGVTVDKKIGTTNIDGRRYELIDLPGTYSLAPQSPDEMVAVDVLLGRLEDLPEPDAVIAIVDASNLERNLYLVSQVLELGHPTIVVLNMMDVAEGRSLSIDVERLQKQLNVPVVPMQANRKIGVDKLKTALTQAIQSTLDQSNGRPEDNVFPELFKQEVSQLHALLAQEHPWPRFLVKRLLLDSGGYLEETMLPDDEDPLRKELLAARNRLAEAGYTVPAVEATARYDWVGRVLEGVVTRPKEPKITLSDRIDRALTHKLGGTLVFVLLMILMFSSVFSWAAPLMGWIADGQGSLGNWIGSMMSDGALRSLVIDGVIAGVGGVLIFLPQIFILFLFIAVLEDCGYMARAAYLMDKLMSRVGLSGKSFIPLLSSFACAIPGIMATRVIENRRDRLTTILVAPLMSCSARLPVYVLLIAAFIPKKTLIPWVLTLQGLIMFSMYMLGIVVAAGVALVLKKTMLKGETPAFVMELPSYKMPSARMVLHRMFDRGWAFIRRAGTLIFAVAIIIWAATYYPHNQEAAKASVAGEIAKIDAQIAAIEKEETNKKQIVFLEQNKENLLAGAYQKQSYLGRAGKWMEPVFKPLGWDWRIGSAAIASFPAREIIVSTLGVIYSLGGDLEEENMPALHSKLQVATWDDGDLQGKKVYNIPVALSIMVFFALCAQCAATLAVIKRETGSWRWPIFTFVYMTTLAYLGALVTYQVGMLFIS